MSDDYRLNDLRAQATPRDIAEFVVSIHSVQSFNALKQLCINFFLANGPTMISYHHLPPPGATDYAPDITFATFGFPQDWNDLYASEKLFEVDPIPKRALATTEPFWWSEVREMPGLNAEEIEFLDKMAKADFGDGLAVPVFGPYGRNGYVGLGFGKQHATLSVLQIKTLQWACELSHRKYCDLVRARSPLQAALSKREHEILEWVANGKSNTVIADIIGISSYTVDTYLRRIFVKLGVSDRVTATLRGLARGELS